MTNPDYRALCAELHEALEKRCETLEEDRLLDRSAAALRAMCAELTDAELANAARKALDSYRYATELHYFLSEDSN